MELNQINLISIQSQAAVERNFALKKLFEVDNISEILLSIGN